MRWLQALRQRLCEHKLYLDDLQPRDVNGIVRCPCAVCGKVLAGECGLYLPGTWIGWRKDSAPNHYETHQT